MIGAAKQASATEPAASEDALLAEGEVLWNGPEEGHVQSVLLFLRAFDRFKSAKAGYRLGCAYMLPRGAARDPARASFYLQVACDAGIRNAHFLMGRALMDDANPQRDGRRARFHLQAAADAGLDGANHFLEKLDRIEDAPLLLDDGPACSVCGTDLSHLAAGNESCPECNAASRTRGLAPVFNTCVLPLLPAEQGERTLLAFAITGNERRVVGGVYSAVTSVSLYGNYGAGHISGVDVRSMPQIQDASCDDIMSICLFDYFIEQEAALKECYRVMRPGGILYTHIGRSRVTAGDEAPKNLNVFVKPINSSEDRIDTSVVGARWFLKTARAVGFVPLHVRVNDRATGYVTDWFVCHKPEAGQTPAIAMDSVAPPPPASPPVTPLHAAQPCTICDAPASSFAPNQDLCPVCHSQARSRTAPLVCKGLEPVLESCAPMSQRNVMGFAMAACEMRALRKFFGELTSVSLYGKYSSDHIEGVDIRDLSRFESNSFCAIYGVLLFDYFTEHDQALREVVRCLKPGGVLFTHIGGYRLSDDDAAPMSAWVIQKRKGYFDYVPDDANMPSIKVGRWWFVEAMKRAGLEARHAYVKDPVFGQDVDWFVGVKPLR